MRKKTISIIASIILSVFCFNNLHWGEIKGQPPRLDQQIEDEDFFMDLKEIVEFTIEQLIIRPNETISLKGKVTLKTETGLPVEYDISNLPGASEIIKVRLTPIIIERSGIRIKIELSQKGKITKSEEFLTRNLESFVVELLENRNKYEKLAAKITPLIKIIEPAKMYPEPIYSLRLDKYRLYKNNTLLLKGSLGVSNENGRSIFLFFFLKEKGIYVISFKPFDGSKPSGVVEDNIIKFKLDNDYFEWLARDSILPEGKWLVWVRNNPDYKMSKEEMEKDSKSKKELKQFVGAATDEKFIKTFFKK
jgi:hypothetical protein